MVNDHGQSSTQEGARSSGSFRSGALRASDAARSNSARASANRLGFFRKSPLTGKLITGQKAWGPLGAVIEHRKVVVGRAAYVHRRNARRSGGCRRGSPEELLDAGDVLGNVHADRVVFRLYHPDAKTVFQPAELLELFSAFKFAGGQGREFKQGIAPERI